MGLSDDAIKLIYGHDINIKEARKIKTIGDMLKDGVMFLANDDITKIEEINKMPIKTILSTLESKIKTQQIPKEKNPTPSIGFKKNNK